MAQNKAMPKPAIAPGQAAPHLSGNPPEGVGRVVEFGDNEFTLVNFWATWCVPCRGEMEALQELHSARGSEGLEIIGVVHEEIEKQRLIEFLESAGITYTVLVPGRGIAGNWGDIRVLPTTFLVDRRGRVLRRYVGANDEITEGLIYDINAVLDGRPLGPFVYPDPDAGVKIADPPR